LNLKIELLADRNIVGVEQIFDGAAKVRLIDGRNLNSDSLGDAQALLVRSVTEVDESLLVNSSVRFVGSATAGLDHVDIAYLERRGINFVSAPGANANSVVEYIISVLANLPGQLERALSGECVGVVGCGHVGSLLIKKLDAIGIKCVTYDPFLSCGENKSLVSFDQLLQCGIISLHTPLTKSGKYPTYHQFNHSVLESLNRGTLLINAGRGATIDNDALSRVLVKRDDLQIVLDVWEQEPGIDADLMRLVKLATPHIAGYSYDGKLAATKYLYSSFRKFFESNSAVTSLETEQPEPLLVAPSETTEELLRKVINSVYDVRSDDLMMRKKISHAANPRITQSVAECFDSLRKEYPIRRELAAMRWQSDELSMPHKQLMQNLGCRL